MAFWTMAACFTCGEPQGGVKTSLPNPHQWGWSLIGVLRGGTCKMNAMEQPLLVCKGRPVLPKPGQIC